VPALVLLASAPIAVALAIALPAANSGARSDVIGSRAALARAAAAAADNYVDRSIAQLATISTRAVIRAPGTSEQVTAELAPIIGADPNWVTFGLSDADGWNLSSFTSAPHTVNIADRDYFRGALATGRPSIGSVILARSLGAKTIIIALPITFADGRRGVFSGALSLAKIGEQIGGVIAGSGTTITLFDEHGTAFVGPGVAADQVGDVSSDPLLPRIQAGASGAEIRSRDGVDEVVGYATAPTPRWGVLLRQPTAAAFGPSDTQLRASAVVTALALALAIGLAWLFGARLARESDRVEAERQRLADLFDHLPARMALLRGPDLRYELVNPASLAGAPADTVLGRSFADVSPDPAYVALLRGVYESGEPRIMSETPVTLTRPDGTRHTSYYNAAIVPLRDRHGAVDAIAYHAVDVTEQVSARTALEQARGEATAALERAETAARVREDFLSIATHELRTPVTSISGYAQLALKALAGGRTERLQPSLETIVRQSERLSVLVTQLLDASRIAGGRLSIEPERTDVSGLVTSAVDAARLRSDAHRWSAEVPPRLQATIDPVRLEQVLTNLFDNAIRYSPAGGSINVRLDVDGPMLRLAVSDEGLGIAPDRVEHVFDRFYRGHEEQGLGGLGLGLYIAREIVERHGGIIDVQSTLGRGTTFTVRMPITSPLAVRDPSPAPSPLPVPDRGVQGRVLVVDDDPDILRLVGEVLGDAGSTVLVAENGEEALRVVADVRPQLIILDKLMPVMDGTTFAATYRRRADAAPIVALCAARDAAEWAASIGAVGYLAKPFNVEQLIATVARHLEPPEGESPSGGGPWRPTRPPAER
jgi:signal transduction histidine kinase/ActR/RegA family two-component response regulator